MTMFAALPTLPAPFATGFGCVSNSSAPASPASPESSPSPDDAFARLAALVRSNDRLQAELLTLDRRGHEARAYLARPDANPALGRARLDRVRDGRSRVLSALRSNRIAAGEFLAPASS